MDDFESEPPKVRALLRKHFTKEKWDAVPEAQKSRNLNMCRHYVEGTNLQKAV